MREPSAMYSACLHCHAPLGSNELIEHFPIGRRLAFDPAKGRLWVVCGACSRWNLSPLEERWESIEECERQFRGIRLRASTTNIGLARFADGAELVRIGSPLRPEIAAWRYGSDFRRRWMTRALPITALAVVAYGANGLISAYAQGRQEGFFPLLGVMGVAGATTMIASWRASHARLVLPDGRVTTRRRGADELRGATLSAVDGGWGVSVSRAPDAPLLTGGPAIHALRCVTTATNYFGGWKLEVDTALEILNEVGDPSRYIRRLARIAPAQGYSDVGSYPAEIKLALEMALHDDIERRALDGELAELEAEWALAEEIAQIADGLLIPKVAVS